VRGKQRSCSVCRYPHPSPLPQAGEGAKPHILFLIFLQAHAQVDNLPGSLSRLLENLPGSLSRLLENLPGSLSRLRENLTGSLSRLREKLSGSVSRLRENLSGSLSRLRERAGVRVYVRRQRVGYKLGGPNGKGDCDASQATTAQAATFCGKVAGSMRSSVSCTVW
jgi:hypothetical protein